MVTTVKEQLGKCRVDEIFLYWVTNTEEGLEKKKIVSMVQDVYQTLDEKVK